MCGCPLSGTLQASEIILKAMGKSLHLWLTAAISKNTWMVLCSCQSFLTQVADWTSPLSWFIYTEGGVCLLISSSRDSRPESGHYLPQFIWCFLFWMNYDIQTSRPIVLCNILAYGKIKEGPNISSSRLRPLTIPWQAHSGWRYIQVSLRWTMVKQLSQFPTTMVNPEKTCWKTHPQ